MTAQAELRQEQPRQRKCGWGMYTLPAWLGISGLALIVARIALPAIPGVFYKVSLNEVQGVCGSPLGLLMTGNRTVHHVCSQANAIGAWLTVGLAAGIVLIALAGVVAWRRTQAGS